MVLSLSLGVSEGKLHRDCSRDLRNLRVNGQSQGENQRNTDAKHHEVH
jgi:hypothetical protein